MFLVGGPWTWELDRDGDGHRNYKIIWRAKGTRFDGPANALQCPGLPQPGSVWQIDNDVDIYAWCRPDARVSPEVVGEPNLFWKIEQKFSTKPPSREKGSSERCEDQQVENPLSLPPQVSGGSTRHTEQGTADRHGFPIVNSSFEQVLGPNNEWDKSRGQVVVEMNVSNLELDLCMSMLDHVNEAVLWGRQPRCVKLSSFRWSKTFWGMCAKYYTRTFEFDTNDETFDRNLVDEGTKVLRGHWQKNPLLPLFGLYIADSDVDPSFVQDFVRFKDWNGENATTLLNGEGLPLANGAEPVKFKVEKYKEADFTQLGIPLTL